MSTYVIVDIGGTQIRAAQVPDEQSIANRTQRISTQSPGTTPYKQLVRLIRQVLDWAQPVLTISVAAPGPLNPDLGIIYDCPNIPGWTDFPIRHKLEAEFNVPVLLGNDANLAALGEWKYGAGQGHKNLLYLTISTGIGGGVIINDQMLSGSCGLAAELGHITMDPAGPLCGCGKPGHLEALASGPAITRWVTGQLAAGAKSILPNEGNLSAAQINKAAQQGDRLSITAIERAGSTIGKAIADYLHIFNPSAVIIGGGVSQSGDMLMNAIRISMAASVMSDQYLENLKLTFAELGDLAGLYGALALAIQTTAK